MILVTGFEPFLLHKENISQQLIDLINKEKISFVQTSILPVNWIEAEFEIKKILNQTIIWNKIYLFGLSSTRSHISVEKYAYNCKSAFLKDNANHFYHEDVCINPEGPSYLTSTYEIDKLTKNITQHGFLAKTSVDPGRYLCNSLYYQVLMQYHLNPILSGHFPQIVFVHLPLSLDINKFAQYFMNYLNRPN